jgi:uncharacterized membrane protein/Fe2+ transport system protein FeoA
MFIGIGEYHHRSIVKAITWRIAGSLDTLVLSYLVTRNFVLAGSIASAETITKVLLYYAHERTWTAIRWGKHVHGDSSNHGRGAAARFRIAAASATALHCGSQLRHLLSPAKLGTVAAFGVCFAVIMSSPQRVVRVHEAAERFVVPTRPEAASAVAQTAGPRVVPALPGAFVTDPSQETPDPSPRGIELAAAQVSSTEDGVPDTSDGVVQQVPENKAESQAPQGDPVEGARAEEVQRRLLQFGFVSTSDIRMPEGQPPQAPSAFNIEDDLAADREREELAGRNLVDEPMGDQRSFVGIWGADATACSPRLNQKGLLPAVIDDEGAWAGETFCAFQSKKRTAEGWTVVANCANTRDRWTANVQLAVSGDRLTWTSQRGSSTYLRCKASPSMARQANLGGRS